MGTNGLLVDVRWEWTGTETTADLLAGATVLPVLDPERVTAEEIVWIAGTGPYEIVNVDVDTRLFTITPGLTLDVDDGTEVATDIGGQPGRAWVCEVILADAVRPVEVPLTIHDLAVMPEGGYDPPVVIVLSDDLASVENLPGSLPLIDGIYIDPENLPPGPQGVPGPPGADGAPQYTWVKYADSPTSGMSDDPLGKAYMGLSYNHYDPTESSVYTDYQWSKVQGDPGPPAGVIDLSATTQVLTQPSGGGATTPATAVVTGVATNTTIVAWEYSSDGAGFSTIPPTGASRAGNVVTITGGTMVAKTITVRMTNGAGGISDSLTVSRVVEGAGGAPGPQGPPGVDAYTLVLSNEAHTFAGSPNAALAGSTTTLVTALKGAIPTNASISNAAITGAPTGMTTAVTGSPGTPTVTVTVTTALVAMNGVLTIPVVVDGFTFNKLFSWSVSRQGTTGTPGTPGTDGTPRYTWTKYADNATGAGFSDVPTATSKYLGMKYNQTSNVESNLWSDYEWSLIQGPQGPVGPTGPQGVQGGQGIPGPAGANGESLYTWLKYADSPTTGMSDSPVGKTYMGVAYNKTSINESTVYTDYSWSLIQGPQGNTGIQGPAGPNGQPTYTWIKYAPNGNPTSVQISDTPGTLPYIGIAYNKTTAAESIIPTDYEWSLIQGPQGSQGIQGPKGADGQSLYTWLKYADSPTSGMNDLPAGKTYMGVAYNKTSSTESSIYTDYQWSLIQGPQGNTGIQGPVGPNGQPTYTWIKYAPNGNPTSGQITDTPGNNAYIGFAYNKTTAAESTVPTDYEWSLIQGPPGPPGLPGATVAPPASPALAITPQDNGFVIQTGPIDIYSTLAYHVSTVSNFTPGPATVVLSGTRNQNVLITAQNGGAAFVRGTTYYFRVVESNNIGSAPASAQVSGQLRVWTQTDIPDLAKAVTDSTKALTDSAAAQSTANSALLQDSLGANPIFNAWASTRPDGWTSMTPASGALTKETTLVRTPPNAVRMNVAAVQQVYLASGVGGVWSTLPNLEYITLTFDFMLVSGTLNNAGAMIRWIQDVSYKTVYVPLTAGFAAGVTPDLGKWYRYTKTIQRPTLSGAFVRIDPYLCGGYSLIEAGNVTAKDIIFDQFSVRAATAEEVTAYNTPAAIAQSATDMQNYVQSRSYNLVTNGSGSLGTNQNFSSCTFTSADAPTGASGSFIPTSSTGARFTDELIPVDPNKTYELAFDFRQVTGQANFYAGVAPYDAYGLLIQPYMYGAQTGTQTTLAAPLNPGDTTVTLASSANWYNGAAANTWQRSIIIWDYVDPGGKKWDPNVYSRNWTSDAYASGGISGNVITLRAPWAGAAIPAGTAISNGFQGSNYMYFGSSSAPAPLTWTHYAYRTQKGVHPGGTPSAATAKFPAMTARIKIVMLTGYAPITAPNQQAFSNVSFAEVTAGDDALILAQSAQTSANGKNRINYGSSVPNATSPGIPGDVWWVTGPLNTIVGQYLCTVGTGVTSGNTWVEQQLTNATIATLDAAKINTGYLNAQRIAANSLSVGQISGLNTTLGILYEMTPIPTLTNNSPVGGSIAWPAFTLKHKDVVLSVPAGSTANSWVIYRWNLGAPFIEQSDPQPVMGVDDFILFANSSGIGLRIFATVLVTGDMIIDGSVRADAIGADQIEARHIHSDAIDASMINTGKLDATVVVAGSLAVGVGITINPDNGIKVSGPIGDSTIPADGSGMVLKGELTASALNISGNFKMAGTTNEIATGASMVVQAGITPPSSGPQITSEYLKHSIPVGYDTRGLVAFPAEDATSYLTTETVYGGTITKLVKNVGTGAYDHGLATFDMEAVRPEIQSAMGGITVLGTEVYTLCQTTEKVPGTSKKRWYRYQWHWVGGATRFQYVTRWLFEPSSNYGGNSDWVPTIGTDGTNILVFQNGTQGWGVTEFNPTTGANLGTTALWNEASKTNRLVADRNGSGIVGTPADIGGALLWWIATTGLGQVYCFTTGGVRVAANEFTMPSQPQSLLWDGTRFSYRDAAVVYDFSQIKDTDLATNPVKAVQTWRLNNDSDTGGDVGDYATYETAKSNISTSTALVKRSWLRLTSTVPIPDDPNDINDPDSLTFYVARGSTPAHTDFKRVPPFTGAYKNQITVLRDTLPTTGGSPPLVTSWGPVTSGKVRSAAEDGVNSPVWNLQGNGIWRMGPLSGGANGLLISRVPILLGRYKNTGSLSAAVGAEFAVGNVNGVTLRNGMSYKCDWRAWGLPSVAATYGTLDFKYGAGLVMAGGTVFTEGQKDWRAVRSETYHDFGVLDWTGPDTLVNFVATLTSGTGTLTLGNNVNRPTIFEVYEIPT